MFCRNCGNKIDDGDLFCSGCGSKVEPLPRLDEIDQTVVLGVTGDAEEQIEYRGSLFEESGLSYNNAVQPVKEAETTTEQETEFVSHAAQLPVEQDASASDADDFSDKPPVLDFSAVTSPLFSDDDEIILQKSDKQPVTEGLTASEKDFLPPEQELNEEDKLISEEESDEVKTVVLSEDDDWDKTILSSQEDNNIYSGAIPGVTSQEFSYPTMDKTYSVCSQGVERQAEDNAAAKVGFNRPAFYDREPDIIKAVPQDYSPQAYAPQSYVQQEFVSHNNNDYIERSTAQNAYRNPPEEPQKSKSVMWVVIVCIAVIFIAIGTVGIVFISQLDGVSFNNSFASFSDRKKEDAEKDKGDKNREDGDSTDAFVATVENTTVETITVPPTTERKFDGSCGADVFYDYDEAGRVLTVFGTGEMQDYEHTDAPWSGKNVARVVIEEGVTSVKEGSFTAISPDTIYLPSTVTSFDVLALSNFGGIEVSPSNRQFKSQSGVLFDKSGTMLIAYPNKSPSTSYTIPSGVKIIGEYAFFQAVNLKSLSISTTVEYIDEYAFSGCYNISVLDIPANVTEIRKGVFYGWVSSQRINVANPHTRAVQNWNEGCGAVVNVAS